MATFGAAVAVVRLPTLLERPAALNTEDATDWELVAAFRQGDTLAADRILRRYAPVVANITYRMMGPNDCEDVFQDCMYRALRKLRQLAHANNVRSWFWSIAVNTSRRALRRQALRRRIGLPTTPLHPDSFIRPSTPPDVALALREVYSVVESLPVKPRQALILRRIEGLKIAEVAEAMGASTASVKRWLAQAVAVIGTGGGEHEATRDLDEGDKD